MSETDEDVDALEMLRCAEINFGNFATAFPGAANHPFFKISMKQLEMGIKALEGDK